jgi:hypothetical protein
MVEEEIRKTRYYGANTTYLAEDCLPIMVDTLQISGTRYDQDLSSDFACRRHACNRDDFHCNDGRHPSDDENTARQ